MRVDVQFIYSNIFSVLKGAKSLSQHVLLVYSLNIVGLCLLRMDATTLFLSYPCLVLRPCCVSSYSAIFQFRFIRFIFDTSMSRDAGRRGGIGQ